MQCTDLKVGEAFGPVVCVIVILLQDMNSDPSIWVQYEPIKPEF
jgi:hypothetical protein